MTFKTRDRSRKYLVRSGLTTAPLVWALHSDPRSEKKPLIVPAQHVELRTFIQEVQIDLQLQAGGSSSADASSFPVGGRLDSMDVVLLGHHTRERGHFAAMNSMKTNHNAALWSSVAGSTT
jgi:hypothetical protein